MIRKKRDLSPDAKLRFPDYLGYFFGAGTNIAGYIVSAFLLIYYSNVLYLGLTQVGVVMAISKCFDGVSEQIWKGKTVVFADDSAVVHVYAFSVLDAAGIIRDLEICLCFHYI